MHRIASTLLLATLGLTACAPGDGGGSAPSVALGPVDGRDLPGTDLERVRVDDLAPDFSLASLAGPVVSSPRSTTGSDLRTPTSRRR